MVFLILLVLIMAPKTLPNALPALSPTKPDWSSMVIIGPIIFMASSPLKRTMSMDAANLPNAPKILVGSTPV